MQGITLANRFAYKRHPVGGVGMGAGGEVQAHVLSTLAKYFVLEGYWSSGELFGSPSCCQTSWIWAGSRGLFTRQHEIQLLQNSLKGEGGHCWDLGGDGLASRFCRSVWKLIGRSFLSHGHDLMTNPMNGCMINSMTEPWVSEWPNTLMTPWLTPRLIPWSTPRLTDIVMFLCRRAILCNGPGAKRHKFPHPEGTQKLLQFLEGGGTTVHGYFAVWRGGIRAKRTF